MPTPCRRQHTVTERLLDRFTKDGVLLVFDCVSRQERTSRPNAEGWVRDFVKWERTESEQRWQEVEGRIGPVLDALDIDGKELLQRAADIVLIRDFIALHMARSRGVAEMWTAAMESTMFRRREEFRQSFAKQVHADYEHAREFVSDLTVQIAIATDGEFLISEAPAVTRGGPLLDDGADPTPSHLRRDDADPVSVVVRSP